MKLRFLKDREGTRLGCIGCSRSEPGVSSLILNLEVAANRVILINLQLSKKFNSPSGSNEQVHLHFLIQNAD